MQSAQNRVLGLLLALGTVSCGGSAPPTDTYLGYVDGTGLDAKFLPATCGKSGSCYPKQSGSAAGTSTTFYNLGLVAASALPNDGTTAKRPVLPASAVATTVYEFPDGCQEGEAFDPRTDAYREDVQYPVFDALPFAATSFSAPPVLPLVKLARWTGTAEHPCNAIKSTLSLQNGVFGGAAAAASSVALRAVIDMTVPVTPLRTGSTFGPAPGWYRGLQLAYLDGGEVAVGADGNVRVMEGVLVHDASAPSKVTDENVLVLQAAPGALEWSPVVRLREFTAPAGVKPSAYKGLCFDPPCAADQVDMTQKPKYAGLLFLVGSTQ